MRRQFRTAVNVSDENREDRPPRGQLSDTPPGTRRVFDLSLRTAAGVCCLLTMLLFVALAVLALQAGLIWVAPLPIAAAVVNLIVALRIFTVSWEDPLR